MHSPSTAPAIDQMNEAQLVAFLDRLATSTAFPLVIDAKHKVAGLRGRLSGGSEYMVTQALRRLWDSFEYQKPLD